MSEITTSWHSYPKIYTLGHHLVRELLFDEVTVEEKVDGSQFSFGIFDGALRCRSKGAQLNVDVPEQMFRKAVATAQELAPQLRPGWTYRGEYLQSPKHNTLAYERTPAKHVILFDINSGHEAYLSAGEKKAEAERLGLEMVPTLHVGRVDSPEAVLAFLERVSVLGGQKIEGVVIKNYKRFAPDGKALMGKYVSEAFKEVHAGDWRERNPNQGDITAQIIASYRTPARWAKSVQRLREAGKLEGSPKDIANLMRGAHADIEEECAAEIKERLYEWAWPQIRRGVTAGLPEWYKEQLLRAGFEEPAP